MDFKAYHGNCRPESVVQGARYRFTILTPHLVRMEYAEDGVFEDCPSQLAINRDFETPDYTVRDTSAGLEIHTEFLSIFYDKGPFTSGGLSVKVRAACKGIYSTWHFGDALTENLGGTIRTLDQADGPVPLEPGIQSRLQGYSVLDDSTSLLLREDGWVEPRRSGATDLYFFGYGYDYTDCLRDFFHLSGGTPLLPRYALGNWWSRFYPYTAEMYLALMDRFQKVQVPLSVAVLDMNWHITDVNPKIGKGWTGYTWNRELIPNPEAFLEGLHKRDLKVTLNLHPADGIQAHEEQYSAAAASLGRDAEQTEPIAFDFCDRGFVRTYFDILLRPLEKNGVDFWWVDWQQGTTARLPGADPLWLLNHFHFLESASRDKRPMILSRYAGPGSHRYPIGFSGDSVISWASLNFQPYLTATAANIGFGWWSHDIGGHCGGAKDAELMTRWVQFGVFSPIMRLHSTSNLFNGKEPWKFDEPAQSIIKNFLCLRHQLIPYMYTLNWRCHKKKTLAILPMYYQHPEQDAAYEVPNQYELGNQLVVCPITTPADAALGLGHTVAWLPDRLYFDFFTGLCYHGGRKLNLYRPLELMPVLAPAGAVIPLTEASEAKKNGSALPEHIEIKIFNGMSGSFELYEDDGESMDYLNGSYATTIFDFNFPKATFKIVPGKDISSVRPSKRQYTLHFVGVVDINEIDVHESGTPLYYTKQYDKRHNTLTLVLPSIDSKSEVHVCFRSALSLAHNPTAQCVFELMEKMHIGYEEKEKIYQSIVRIGKPQYIICELQAIGVAPDVLNAVAEILFAE